MNNLDKLILAISENNLRPTINLDRPYFVQPEDRIDYRSARLILIVANLNLEKGLSKKTIACVDFLLRNDCVQSKFIIEYFKKAKDIDEKILKVFSSNGQLDIDFNIVQYKSVPWDLRYNDMYMLLFIRKLIELETNKNKSNAKIKLSNLGDNFYKKIQDIFPKEMNFLDLFDGKIVESRLIEIVTNIIPKTYWLNE